MYFVLYDRNLNTIGQTYILESWNRTQRAVDFDDLKITGEQIPVSADPFIVVANNKVGKMLFSGLASTPSIDEKQKKTSISLKDYATLFNTEIIVDWSKFTGKTVANYLTFVLDTWLNQTDVGLENILYDVSKITDIELDINIKLGAETENEPGAETENVSVHDLIFDAINYYGLYYDTELSLSKKTLTFKFLKSGVRTQEIKLADFNLSSLKKSFGEFNRATVYKSDYSWLETWALTEDNSIVKLPSEKNLVYPAKNKNYVAADETADAVNSAIYDAAMGLAGNRYQENIDLNVQQYRSIVDLSAVDFSYNIRVYSDEGFYKTLPVGEIESDSTGNHIVTIGYRIQELTQEI